MEDINLFEGSIKDLESYLGPVLREYYVIKRVEFIEFLKSHGALESFIKNCITSEINLDADALSNPENYIMYSFGWLLDEIDWWQLHMKWCNYLGLGDI